MNMLHHVGQKQPQRLIQCVETRQFGIKIRCIHRAEDLVQDPCYSGCAAKRPNVLCDCRCGSGRNVCRRGIVVYGFCLCGRLIIWDGRKGRLLLDRYIAETDTTRMVNGRICALEDHAYRS